MMYIDPFLAGILTTIGAELILLVIGGIITSSKNKGDK